MRFPHTRGGVPLNLDDFRRYLRFPHTRGGVPELALDIDANDLRFPHTRGCVPYAIKTYWGMFVVFPTRVGVYRLDGWGLVLGYGVFPTRVGVYRTEAVRERVYTYSFPHTRGGVPIYRNAHPNGNRSFPHTRGGVPNTSARSIFMAAVFPTRVGVYRTMSPRLLRNSMFSPHAWGCTAD